MYDIMVKQISSDPNLELLKLSKMSPEFRDVPGISRNFGNTLNLIECNNKDRLKKMLDIVKTFSQLL